MHRPFGVTFVVVINYDVVYFWLGGVGVSVRFGGVVLEVGLSTKIRQSKTPQYLTLFSYLPLHKLCGAIPQFLPMLAKRAVCKLAPPQTKDGILYKCPQILNLKRVLRPMH